MMPPATRRRPARRERAPEPASDLSYLVIGQVVGARGLGGELKVRIETDDPERFFDLEWAYLGEEHERWRVESARLFKGVALLKLAGVSDRTAAEALRSQYVYVSGDDALPLAEGEYYYHQIEGLRVRSDTGEDLGRVTEILSTGANDVYVVMGPEGELLLPAIKEVILDIDLEHELLTVHLLEGLR
jgi:16S rRNA processing protein RimM